MYNRKCNQYVYKILREEVLRMAVDYSLLWGKIKSSGYTQLDLSKKLGIARTSLSNKLNGKAQFKQSEIIMLCEILGISKNDISRYFFA